MLKRTLWSMILCLLAFSVAAKPISGEKLFRRDQTQMLRLSPDSRYIVAAILGDDGTESLILRYPEKGKSYSIAKLTDDDDNYLISFEWVDKDTLYFDYKTASKKAIQKAFVHMRFDGEVFNPWLERIKAKGTIIDYLPNQPGKVLFSRDEGGRRDYDYKLYMATTEQLVNDHIGQAEKVAGPQGKVWLYKAVPSNHDLIAATISDETATIWYRKGSSAPWAKLGDIKTFDHDFKFVGVKDDYSLVVLSNENTDQTALMTFDLKTQQYGDILFQHDTYDLVDAAMTDDGSKIAYVRYYDHGKLVTQYFNNSDRRIKKKMALSFPGKQFIIIDNQKGFDDKLVSVFSADEPGKYYFYDASKNQLVLIGVTLPDIDPEDLGRSEVFSVTSSDDLPIEGILTRPKRDSNDVLLVMPHGGPIGIREYDTFDPEVQFLVSRGFSVLQVNFRGSSGYGKSFEHRGVGQFGKAIERDIGAAVSHVRSKYHFDSMCSIGASYGGYSAVMLAMKFPDQYQCVVARYGIYDLPFLFNSTNRKLGEKETKAITSVVGEKTQALEDSSPFFMVEKLKAPLLLVAGKKDQVAWFEQSNRLKYRLKQLNKSFEYLFYNKTGHGHDSYYGDRHEFAYIDRFLRKTLNLPYPKGKESRKLLGDELFLLGDAYTHGWLIDKDNDKALALFRQGASLDNAASMFDIGSYYHRGLVVDKSLEEAVSWYQKSSDAGDEDASFRLGGLYRSDKLGKPDYQRSMAMFVKAQSQGNKLALLEIARLYCLGQGVQRDMNKCREGLMVKDKKNKKFRNRREEIMAELFWHDDMGPRQRQALKTWTYQLHSADELPVKATLDEWGVFKNKGYGYKFPDFVRLGDYWKPLYMLSHDSTTDTVDVNEAQAFGASFEISAGEDVEGLALFKVRWTTPEVTDGKVTATDRTETSLAYFPLKDGIAQFLYPLNAKWKKVAADWKLEVYTLDDSKVFEKTFHTVVSD